jgi:hypothetical protein
MVFLMCVKICGKKGEYKKFTSGVKRLITEREVAQLFVESGKKV